MRLPTKRWFRLGLLCCVLFAVAAGISSTLFRWHSPLVVDKSQIFLNPAGERVYNNQPFTGEAVTYHSSGKLASAEQFQNGRRHGYLKNWFTTGLLGYEANFQLGLREGFSSSWWNNGNTRSQTFYVNDKPDGVVWKWYRGGEKFNKLNYVAGTPTGLQQGWRINGKLFANYEYRNGRVYGLSRANLCVELKDETLSIDS